MKINKKNIIHLGKKKEKQRTVFSSVREGETCNKHSRFHADPRPNFLLFT